MVYFDNILFIVKEKNI